MFLLDTEEAGWGDGVLLWSTCRHRIVGGA